MTGLKEEPPLKHTLQQADASVLSLVAQGNYIFSGSQECDIYVWNRNTFQLKTRLHGHTGSVLALEVAQEKDWLFSSSGDSTIRIWSTNTLLALYKISPYLECDAGDLFSLAWAPSLQTLYVGCQNTSIQWVDLSPSKTEYGQSSSEPESPHDPPEKRFHKFFDSFPQYERKPPGGGRLRGYTSDTVQRLFIPVEHVVTNAHYGYVYCMAMHTLSNQSRGRKINVLVSGSGDECVKIWCCSTNGLQTIGTLESSDGAILSIVTLDSSIYAGCQGGRIKVWDMETQTLIRNIIAHEAADIMALSIVNRTLLSCTSDGTLQGWSDQFENIADWKGHSGITHSSFVIAGRSKSEPSLLMTGGNDGNIKLWELPHASRSSIDTPQDAMSDTTIPNDDSFLGSLAEFVALQSVSSSELRQHCRQTAVWLTKHFSQLGAESAALSVVDEINPVVLAIFKGKESRSKKRILFYGHYDVVSAPSQGWESHPFSMTARNGYFYGRGISDNKGPLLAFAHTASKLLLMHQLDVDLVMLIEGEEEMGSKGLLGIIRQYKQSIGRIDAIIISNSYWIGENTPCITYGLRGLIHAKLLAYCQTSSGMEGGDAPEAMQDLIQLLAALSSDGRIAIPGFYDSVRPLTQEESQFYDKLASATGQSAASFVSRWREPSLTVHSIDVSGPKNATVIPSAVTADISVRIVPDQKLDEIVDTVISFLHATFEALRSQHQLVISIDRTADWWLGDLDGPWFRALENAIEKVWQEKPLRIREGGSIPSIPLLEKEFGCPILHLPMGQSTDQAHLHNERISMIHLLNGKQVAEELLRDIGNWQYR